MLVKICGLRDPRNILEVIGLKPDLIGLIFYPESPRYVSDTVSLEFLRDLPGRPKTVGVFVGSDMERIRSINRSIGLDAVQLHGSETPELCAALRQEGFIVIKAFGIKPGFDFRETGRYRDAADFFLFDTGGSKPGGSGEQFDWDLLEQYHGEKPFFLSGGLNPETVVLPVHPMLIGVDLNSRFESAPGIKDAGSLNRFLNHFRHE